MHEEPSAAFVVPGSSAAHFTVMAKPTQLPPVDAVAVFAGTDDPAVAINRSPSYDAHSEVSLVPSPNPEGPVILVQLSQMKNPT